MKAVWVTRSFLDYRIPVYKELCRCLDGQFTLFYNADYVPQRCCKKVQNVLGTKAKGLHREFCIGPKKWQSMANKEIRISYQRGLIKAVLNENPDVMISDGFFQWTYAPLWLRATRHIPHIMCYERTSYTERNAQFYRRAYRKSVLRWIDAICCNGKLCGEYVKSLGFPPERITYGHMVADVNNLVEKSTIITNNKIQQKRSELELNGLVFLYVGQIIPRKGIMQLLQSWKIFSREVGMDKYSLLLVGNGLQMYECRSYCKDNNLDNVRFTGEITHDKLPLYYKCGDVLIMPTLEDNWSLVVPEAMACGLPILCSKYNGCWPELARDSLNGWVFDPLDISDTVRILQSCLCKNSQLQQMGKTSKQIISKHTASQAVDAIMEGCDIATTAL